MTDATSSLTTLELVADAIDVLRDGDVLLGGAEIDYAAADMLNVLADLHIERSLNLEVHAEVRKFARLVIDGWPL